MSLKILLVDDDDSFRAVTAIALESEGCVVHEANSGDAALAALQLEKPDVIVSDLDMPGLDGFELCHQVRANPHFSQIHFVLLSALIEPDGTGIPSQHEADCCLSKQIHIRQLLRQIQCLTDKQIS